jgi:adenylate kinase
MKLAIMGPPGSGKGTQAEIISKKYKLKYIYTGDLLRKEERRRTKLGKLISSLIDKGNYMSSEVVIQILKSRIPKDNFILDGSPRRIGEAEWLEKNHALDLFINLEVKEKTMVERLSKRRICLKCGELYHLVNKKPRKNNVCDKCGSKLSVREDDKPKIIKHRIKVYKKESLPVTRFYDKLNKILHVNGEGRVEETSKKIFKAIESLKKKGL